MSIKNYLGKSGLALITAAMSITLFFASMTAQAACSAYKGQVVINEYNFIQNWVELKILAPAVVGNTSNFAGWKLWIFRESKPGSPASQNVGSMYANPADNTCGTSSGNLYIRIPFAGSDMSNDVNVVLADSSNNIVDIFRVDQTAVSSYYSGFNACTFTFSNLTDAPPAGSSSQKDFSRLPDGTGPWIISPGTGSNSQETLCSSNNSMLGLTKIASSSSVAVNTSFTFTITATNGGSSTDLTNVTVTDVLPAGFTFVSATPSTGSASYTAPTLTWNAGTLIPGASATLILTVQAAATGSYTNTASSTAAELSPGYTEASATVNVTNISVGNFNAFETSTAAGAVAGNIYTKIAGNGFNLDVVAINGGVQNNSFSGAAKVELLANTTPGSGYGADNCPASNSVIQTIASANITGGRSAVSFAAVADAWKDVRVKISYPTASPTVTSCSTDSFAIRPDSFFGLSVTDSDWQTAGVARTLNNTSASGGNVHKAGQPFTIRATAQNALSSTTSNYNDVPIATLIPCADTGCTGTFGVFSIAAAAASGVIATTATYSEAGSFNMELQDRTFASIDASDGTLADCSASGYYICSATVATGRFVPDHFDTITSGGMPCPAGLTCPTQFNGFVYSSQPFTTQVTARNAAGAITLNYDSAKNLSKAVTLSAWDAAGGAASNPGGGTLALNTVPSTAFILGMGITNTPAYSLPNPYPGATPPPGPTDIYVRAEDTDSVTSLRGVSSVEGGIKIVSGRLNISNAHGSEWLPLPIAVSAQYWNGSNYVTSSTDSVSSFAAANVLLANCQKLSTVSTWPTATCLPPPTSVSPASVVFASGKGNFKLAIPGAGKTGSVDMTINAPAYLPSNTARATFGVYKGASEFIYLRENY